MKVTENPETMMSTPKEFHEFLWDLVDFPTNPWRLDEQLGLRHQVKSLFHLSRWISPLSFSSTKSIPPSAGDFS